MPVMNSVKSPICRHTVTSCSGWKCAGSSQTACVSRSRSTTVSSRGTTRPRGKRFSVRAKRVSRSARYGDAGSLPSARSWKLARSARSKKARNSTARMIANLRICYHPSPMADRPNARFPWLLIAASVLLVLVILYVLFVGYLPAKQRIAGLEAELKDLYRREADLQTKIAQQDQRYSVRERQISALTSERDTLIRRLEELERLLGTGRSPRR